MSGPGLEKSFTWVSADWVEQRLDSPEVLLLDPRSSMRYLAGHPKNAVSLPVAQARDAQGSLRSTGDLAHWIGLAGLDDSRMPVVYDSVDGRNAAMLAWILAYLGRHDVHVMNIVWERWVEEGREAFYRPVKPPRSEFRAKLRPEMRVTLEAMRSARSGGKRVDFRSRDEFTGKLDADWRPGHIPGAINVVWQELAGENGRLLAPREKLAEIFAARGVGPDDRVIAYCHTGLRAALGFLALAEAGWKASLYDGSYAEWARTGLPVETSETDR